MDEEKDFIIIEEYLDGLLQGQALADFEKRLKEDPELAKEMALYREMNEQLLAGSEKKALKQEWAEIIAEGHQASETPKEQNVQTPASGKIRTLGFYLKRIAALGLLLIIAWFLWPKPSSNGQIAEQYWEQTDGFNFAATDRSNSIGSAELKTLENAYAAYHAEEYQKTIELTGSIGSASSEILLLQGAAFFKMDDHENALRSFEQILQQTDTEAQDEARWYLALTYLKNNKLPQATSALKVIVEQQSWKHREALDLLNQISK